MSIKNLLNKHIRAAMIEAGLPEDCSPNITKSIRPEFGDFQVNGTMAAAKMIGSNPRQLAKNIVNEVNLEGIAKKLR